MTQRGIEAVTIDFFNTLVLHRDGRGRGLCVVDYLQRHGLEPAPWRHEFLYEIFDAHDTAYSPARSSEQRHAYHVALAKRLLRRLDVAHSDDDAARHASALWEILGPTCFDVFPDVREALDALKRAGYRLALVSNWPRGLSHFCTELGLSVYFDHVLASGEIGAAKPDGRIFAEASRRLGIEPARILHVGDSPTDDYDGARAAAFRVVLVDRERDDAVDSEADGVIHGLDELPAYVSLVQRSASVDR